MKRALLALPLLALLAGCAGYRLGSPVPEACRPIHVAAFENQTDYPMVGTLASQQLLDALIALIEDGTFAPTAYDNARLRVQAVIQPLNTDAVRYSRNYNLVPDEYHVALTARLYVFDAKTGKTYVNGKPITAVDSALTALTREDYQTGIQDALPRVARRLAQSILTELHALDLPQE